MYLWVSYITSLVVTVGIYEHNIKTLNKACWSNSCLCLRQLEERSKTLSLVLKNCHFSGNDLSDALCARLYSFYDQNAHVPGSPLDPRKDRQPFIYLLLIHKFSSVTLFIQMSDYLKTNLDTTLRPTWACVSRLSSSLPPPRWIHLSDPIRESSTCRSWWHP